MKQIKNMYNEIRNKSTGCFKDGDGDIYYLLNGECHRVDGPAVEFTSGIKWWFLYGKRHRSDGPAVEHANGNIYKSWYLYGIKAESKEQFYDAHWRRRVEIKIFL